MQGTRSIPSAVETAALADDCFAALFIVQEIAEQLNCSTDRAAPAIMRGNPHPIATPVVLHGPRAPMLISTHHFQKNLALPAARVAPVSTDFAASGVIWIGTSRGLTSAIGADSTGPTGNCSNFRWFLRVNGTYALRMKFSGISRNCLSRVPTCESEHEEKRRSVPRAHERRDQSVFGDPQ